MNLKEKSNKPEFFGLLLLIKEKKILEIILQ